MLNLEIPGLSVSLMQAMVLASESCTNKIDEEGGLILKRNEDCCFVKVENKYAGTDIAGGLYETEMQSLSKNVFPLLKEGWQMFASFHTHPMFSASPSSIDMTKLFLGFKYNVIFAPVNDVQPNMFSITIWENDKPYRYYINKHKILELISSL